MDVEEQVLLVETVLAYASEGDHGEPLGQVVVDLVEYSASAEDSGSEEGVEGVQGFAGSVGSCVEITGGS